MYATERHQAIAGLVREHGRVAVTDVASSFGVTTETVRRDLAVLERAGLLRRVHGGAVDSAAMTVVERGIAERDVTHAPAKDRIARAALDLVPPAGGSIALDAGTTTGRVADLLAASVGTPGLPPARTSATGASVVTDELVVVTNSVPIAARLLGAPVRLHLLGGRVRGTTGAAVGQETVAALADLRVDVTFLGTNGLTVARGLTTPDTEEAAVKRALVAAGRRVVALADSSKIGEEHLVRFVALSDVDVLVTDDGIPERVLRALRANEIEVLVA